MLKMDMIDKFNEQMNFEFYFFFFYQQMSVWCSYYSFEGVVVFLCCYVQEEMIYMQCLFDYLIDIGSLLWINVIVFLFVEYVLFDELFCQIYEYEQLIM